MKVVKFGGSSLANAESIHIARNIVLADSSRTFVVVSAPGKCREFPRKITDLLIEAYAEMQQSDESESLDKVLARFCKISNDLGIDIAPEIERVREDIILNQSNYDFVVSRGEYLMALLFARVIGYKFIDAANFIVIKRNGKFHEKVTVAKFARCVTRGDKIVMGGFYGSFIDGGVQTFSRGGSDYSGAIAAVCLNAELYENFTDTYGVQTANPSILKHTKSITQLDFTTMHKLSVAGASVIHPDCLPLLKSHEIPLRVDNTFDSGKYFTNINTKAVNAKYFCITYKFEQNINKDTVEILCMFSKMIVGFTDLRRLLKDTEVYLVRLDKKSFTLIAPSANLNSVVSMLHDYLIKL